MDVNTVAGWKCDHLELGFGSAIYTAGDIDLFVIVSTCFSLSVSYSAPRHPAHFAFVGSKSTLLFFNCIYGFSCLCCAP